ncbi:unnamed protein product, partial [Sphacelaria rigidula]
GSLDYRALIEEQKRELEQLKRATMYESRDDHLHLGGGDVTFYSPLSSPRPSARTRRHPPPRQQQHVFENNTEPRSFSNSDHNGHLPSGYWGRQEDTRSPAGQDTPSPAGRGAAVIAAAVNTPSSLPPREMEYHGSPLAGRGTTRRVSSPRGSSGSDRDSTRSESDRGNSVRALEPVDSPTADGDRTREGLKPRSCTPRDAEATLRAEHQHPQHHERRRQHANCGFSGSGDDGVRG